MNKKRPTWLSLLLFIGIPAAVVVVAILIDSAMDESNLHRAQAAEELAASSAALEDRVNQSEVDLVRTVIGPTAAATLNACFSAGYELKPHPPGQAVGRLSRRRTAECDAIINRVAKAQRASDREEARKDAEYDKAHPVK